MLIISITNALITWFLMFFLFSEYGQSVTDAFDDVNQSVYNISWYLCSNGVQKLLVTIINASQDTVRFKGYASIHSSRDMFKGVRLSISYVYKKNVWTVFVNGLQIINTGCSYFMMLRRFNN